MTLYFLPLACSLAARIALDEAGIAANYSQVKRGDPGFAAITSTRRVPALRLDDGKVLTEATAVLLYIADRAPPGALAPDKGSAAWYEMVSWLSFTATELHKKSIGPLIATSAPEAVKAHALSQVPADLAVVEAHLKGRDWLASDAFTVADAYLFAVLNWLKATPVDLTAYPIIAAYHGRLLQRPAVSAAFALEYQLYRAAA